MISKDYINGMLGDEYRTTNGIPTNRMTHNLFYVSRTRSAIVWLLGVVGGMMIGFAFAHAAERRFLWALLAFTGSMMIGLPSMFLNERDDDDGR